MDPSPPADSPCPPLHRHVVFPVGSGLAAVTDGLETVRQALSAWHLRAPQTGLDQDPAADALLVAAELLANAERHGHGARSLDLRLDPARHCLRIAVTDTEPAPPRPAVRRRSDRPGGHGLHILSHLAYWGTTPHPGGKTVWAELPVAEPPARA